MMDLVIQMKYVKERQFGHVVPATHQQRDRQLLLSAEEDEELT